MFLEAIELQIMILKYLRRTQYYFRNVTELYILYQLSINTVSSQTKGQLPE